MRYSWTSASLNSCESRIQRKLPNEIYRSYFQWKKKIRRHVKKIESRMRSTLQSSTSDLYTYICNNEAGDFSPRMLISHSRKSYRVKNSEFASNLMSAFHER